MIDTLIPTKFTAAGFLRYTFTPEVGPRLKALFDGGFSNLALFMALIYHAVKLLPDNHPYIKSGVKGSFSVRDVLVEASKNVHFDLKHIDQIIIYFALIAGVIILALQFLFLLAAIVIRPASAQSEAPSNFFVTNAPSEDIAFRFLDSVFGIPNLFGSKEPTETAFHTALHGLLQFYSIGLLVIGAMLLIYFIFVVFAETAQTGTPFGKRYKHAWVPIRLVVAFGLLIPISYGMNSAQWITLYAAKFGSGFATNGWIQFNEVLRGESTLGNDIPVAEPNLPSLNDLSGFMMLAHACKYSYMEIDETGNILEGSGKNIDAYILDQTAVRNSREFRSTDYARALRLSNNRNIQIVFGEKADEHSEHPGGIYPYCGKLTLIVTEPITSESGGTVTIASPSAKISLAYFNLLRLMWQTDYESIDTVAKDIVLSIQHNQDREEIPASLRNDIAQAQREFLSRRVKNAIEQSINEFENGSDYLKYGWGGAGIFYNDIANINGRILNGVLNKPELKAYPTVMQYTCEEVEQESQNTSPSNCYSPYLPNGQTIDYPRPEDAVIAKTYDHINKYWHELPNDLSGNGLVNIINVMFGTQGLFDMCKNADVHPLAQLSTLGKGLVETAIRNIGLGIGLGFGSIIPVIGPTAGALSKMAMTFASIGILIGFILFYLLPFMPFLYFMFAVGGWVKGIFEAMVGVPLWALSHIRIDGEGLPGDGAINGYFLIFEIFLRPILVVFGLIAAVVTFGAMIKVLNSIFGIVINNLSGNDPTLGDVCFQDAPDSSSAIAQQQREAARQDAAENFRGPIDEFFYTVVYAILVYMIGMASFKMIDLVPNNILRWMGQGIETFGDQQGEPAEGLISKMAIGGSVLGGKLQEAGSGLGQGVAGLGKGLASSFNKAE